LTKITSGANDETRTEWGWFGRGEGEDSKGEDPPDEADDSQDEAAEESDEDDHDELSPLR